MKTNRVLKSTSLLSRPNYSVLNTLVAQDIGSADNGNYAYLEYICIDDIPGEFEQIASLRNEDTVVVTDCEFLILIGESSPLFDHPN